MGVAVLLAACGHWAPRQGEDALASSAAAATIHPAQDAESRMLSKAMRLPSQMRGRELYRYACASCHGSRGNGLGPSAAGLDPLPRDFTRALYKWRHTESGSLPQDADIFRTITKGVPGTTMPAWGKLLSEQERWDLVEHLKSFSVRFKEEPLQDDEIVKLPEAALPATAASIAQGRKVYEEMKCWECHGPAGRGDGPSSTTLKDSWDRAIRPFDFSAGLYRCGDTDRDIYTTFYTGLNGTPMPSFALTIPDADRWPLVHYVRSLQRTPGPLERWLLEAPILTPSP